ncbi:MAG: FlgD immunoglobulin-like domain containing protein [Candidatus Cloacimonadales bacterium]|nr:FlgD immunoglobulin-like domain containing protein [Candidatus Cloacimonadales bacterium]
MKKIILVTLLMLCVSVVFADCDMAAMIAKAGYSISTLNTGSGSYDDPDEFIDFLIAYSSASTNPDGYGVTYIDGNGIFPTINTTSCSLNFYSAQAWYVTAQNINSNNYYYNLYTGPMEAARDAIKLDANDVAIVLGHDRRSDTAKGNHPFRFIYDINTTFQFMHNGGIDNDIKLALYTELGGSNWFSLSNHPSNWWNTNNGNPACNQLIDSEVLFHWIMKNIMESNGDILSGVQKALTATIPVTGGEIDLEEEFRTPYYIDPVWHNVVNFVLTDGETLYLFRNGGNSWDHHLLSWQENDNNSYTVKTRSELDNGLDQFDFVILSRDDDPVVYHDFFDFDKHFSSGWNWESFPRLERDETINEEKDIVPIFETIQDFEDISLLDMRDVGNWLHYISNPYQWSPPAYDIYSTDLYKIDVDPEDDWITVIPGTRLDPDYTFPTGEELAAGTYHWLGYWLPQTQDMDVAFGEFWEYVEEVKAEEWYYGPQPINDRDVIIGHKPSLTMRALEYGKGYEVKFSEEISGFHWSTGAETAEGYERSTTENFICEEQPDYEVIDVLGIPENIVEIGVFQDSVCVGAVTVQDTCEQILVYVDNSSRDQIPYNFEVVSNNRSIEEVISYHVFNEDEGIFEQRSLIAGCQPYSIIRFGSLGELQNETPVIGAIQLHDNYPNPFNPETNISFSLPQDQEIELIVYNLKGQKVRQLVSGRFASGQHSVVWGGKDDNGKKVSSGLYLYKLKANDLELTKKMLLLK